MKQRDGGSVRVFVLTAFAVGLLGGSQLYQHTTSWRDEVIVDRDEHEAATTPTPPIASQCVAPGWRAIPVPGGWTGIEDPRCK